MQPLDRTLRRQLENTIKEAREEAEAGARAAIEQFGVGAKAAFPHLSGEEKELRRKLRIHGKQLGDQRDSKSTNPTVGEQETVNLVEEVAYEHWHRMLFARFLAENNLLMYPDEDDSVPVTLEECEDLAADEGAANGWEVAARFASRMLPQIFRPDSPVFQLSLPPERQHRLERLLADLPQEVFHASDALGWVYQFWQAKRKNEVNDSGVKIGARELPAVTQLFTEPYTVSFLLDNTLGAWWAGKRLSECDLANAKSENELRQKASLPGMSLEYLRFVQCEGDSGGDFQRWRPAAGTFDGWPERISELKVLDPCCGSGHFLVAAFQMLVPMRMAMDGLSEWDAVDAVLAENLHGLEIDKRCTEIAAFALAFAAWKRTDYRPLPDLQIACTGLAPRASADEWIELVEKSDVPMSAVEREPVKRGLQHMHDLFSQAPTLGSLINPTDLPTEGFAADFETLKPYVAAILDHEDTDAEMRERAIMAAGMVKAADLLAGGYALVVTNVPYLGRGKQSLGLREFIENSHSEAKFDLAYALLNRSLELLIPDGAYAVVMPQNWMFQVGSADHRKSILKRHGLPLITRLGEHAFESTAAAGAFVCLYVFSEKPGTHGKMATIDAVQADVPADKARLLRLGDCQIVSQSDQLKNPDFRIALSKSDSSKSLLSEVAEAYQGLVTGDIGRFVLKFWEVGKVSGDWRFIRGAVDTGAASGLEDILLWENANGELHEYARVTRDQLHDMHESGNPAWGRPGIAINRVRNLRASAYWGEAFHNSVAVISPHDEDDVPALFEYCRSDQFFKDVREIDGKLSVTNRTLLKVPVDLEHWRTVAQKIHPDGIPRPESNCPTQWVFHGRPDESTDPLQTAVARLLGYRWPAELDDKMELSDRARKLAKRCDELLPLADRDGIVCIPPIGGEASAADRLHNLLAKAHGDAWSAAKLNELLKQADHADKSLDSWLRDKFFTQHCQLFHQRPFIWHIWDGLRDGFSVLVNYHKLDHKNLQTLIYNYLGDWISRQRRDLDNGVDDAEEKLGAAEALKKRLELTHKGQAPYDIFIRWKPLEEQPSGWQPDLNDGVRLNIRPFMTVPDVKKKGSGVLRDKPKIHWKKDKGKDVKSAPWYHLGPEYGGKEGDRINDHHLTLEEKEAAREAVQEAV